MPIVHLYTWISSSHYSLTICIVPPSLHICIKPPCDYYCILHFWTGPMNFFQRGNPTVINIKENLEKKKLNHSFIIYFPISKLVRISLFFIWPYYDSLSIVNLISNWILYSIIVNNALSLVAMQLIKSKVMSQSTMDIL